MNVYFLDRGGKWGRIYILVHIKQSKFNYNILYIFEKLHVLRMKKPI